MNLADAKLILSTVLQKEIADSLVEVYMLRDSINKNTIQLQVKEIRAFQQKDINNQQQISNLESIIKNKGTEIELLNKTLLEEKKATKKQRRLKNLGIIGSIVLPITTFIVMFSILG
jgi:hypothetical protein